MNALIVGLSIHRHFTHLLQNLPNGKLLTVEAIQEELDKMAMAEDRIEMLNKHFESTAKARELLQEDDGAQLNINFNE